jgi:hypothetical protein
MLSRARARMQTIIYSQHWMHPPWTRIKELVFLAVVGAAHTGKYVQHSIPGDLLSYYHSMFDILCMKISPKCARFEKHAVLASIPPTQEFTVRLKYLVIGQPLTQRLIAECP